MDTNRIRELLDQRDALDEEIKALVNGEEKKERKPTTCKTCGEEGHTSRTCPKKQE